MLFLCMSPSPLESSPISFDMPLLHFILSGTLIRCQYSLEFPGSGHVIALAFPGSKVILLVTWSIMAHYSPSVRTRGNGLLGVEVRVLMVATWFAMGYFTWRCLARVLYLCSCGTLGVTANF